MYTYNDPGRLFIRKKLRSNAPKTEQLLWFYLKNRKLGGYKFRRQYEVLGYVLDFYCSELRLAVEVDGSTHDSKEAQSYDLDRESNIQSLNIEFIRFKNIEVYCQMSQVLKKLNNKCLEVASLKGLPPT